MRDPKTSHPTPTLYTNVQRDKHIHYASKNVPRGAHLPASLFGAFPGRDRGSNQGPPLGRPGTHPCCWAIVELIGLHLAWSGIMLLVGVRGIREAPCEFGRGTGKPTFSLHPYVRSPSFDTLLGEQKTGRNSHTAKGFGHHLHFVFSASKSGWGLSFSNAFAIF